MTTYEYEVVESVGGRTSYERESLQGVMDEMASDGWRLVEVVQIGDDRDGVNLIFEREYHYQEQ